MSLNRRVIVEDFSGGHARHSVPVVGEGAKVEMPSITGVPFTYTEGYITGCNCKPGQCLGKECACVAKSSVMLHRVSA